MERETEREREGGDANYDTLPCATSPVYESTLKPSEHFEVKFLSFNFESDILHWKFRLLSLVKASCDRIALPNLRWMLGVLVFP